MTDEASAQDVPFPLSRPEWEVLRLVAQGRTDHAIAAELGVPTRTVRDHLDAVYEKIGVPSRTKAVVWVHERANRLETQRP